MFSSNQLLAGLAFAGTALAQNKWEFYAYSGLPGMLSYGRLDPIVSPGAVSSHVHMIQGANAFGSTFDYNTIRNKSTCSTIQVQDDLSNYWAPAMYSYNGSTFSLMLAKFFVYYQFNTYSYDPDNIYGTSRRYPFPEGLKMLAGSTNQRSLNYSSLASLANRFQCVRNNGSSPYSYDMRDFQIPGAAPCDYLRATTTFPSCWDGITDTNDLSHVGYPVYNGKNLACPADHPYAMMQLTFEWFFPTGQFPFDNTRQNNWVLSFGDTSGLGFHGDFTNGWNTSLLVNAINNCNTTENGIENCPPFSRWNSTQIPPCMPTGLYPNEPVGVDGQALTALPGCNKLWTDNSTKPTCSPAPATPSINTPLGPNLTQWNYVSCPLLFQSGGLLLSARAKTNWNNMTVDSCLSYCSGYKYALATFGNQCYCDNQPRANATLTSDPNYACQARCPGNYLELCGGYGSAQLYQAISSGASLVASSTANALQNVATNLASITVPNAAQAAASNLAGLLPPAGSSSSVSSFSSSGIVSPTNTIIPTPTTTPACSPGTGTSISIVTQMSVIQLEKLVTIPQYQTVTNYVTVTRYPSSRRRRRF